MKKIVSLVIAAMMVLLVGASFALAEAAQIQRVKYEGNGLVDVEFLRDVGYDNLTITVSDSLGNAYTTTIVERDDDDLTFRVDQIAAGEEYTFTISGVRSGRSGEYGSVTGTFSTPEEGQVGIETVEYEADEREVEIDFIGRVEFDMNCTVTMTDAMGNTYNGQILKMDEDSLEVYVEGLTRGETYTVLVTGVRNVGQAEFGSVEWEFQAVEY